MDGKRSIWLVANAASGSYAEDAIDALEDCCGHHGFSIARRTLVHEGDPPSPAELEAAGIALLTVFAGDGTTNAVLGRLAGWGGQVLVLPGGTMNLLYHRLHGHRSLEEVVAAVASGEARPARPKIVRCPFGDAYAGVLAGPGTSWGEVREALREAAMPELAANTVRAVEETLGGEWIVCVEPAFGRPEGYPLINLTPYGDGMDIEAYHAESPDEYLEQAWALLKRNFREGPHDILGRTEAVRLGSVEGHAFGLLIDGERVESAPTVEFRLVPCDVDLLATETDGF